MVKRYGVKNEIAASKRILDMALFLLYCSSYSYYINICKLWDECKSYKAGIYKGK